MERVLVIVFESELNAYEGSKTLTELDSEGIISIHAQAVIEKMTNGKVSISQKGDEFPVRTVEGTGIGALIGLLGGPAGLVVGAVSGTLAGNIWGLNRAGVTAEFLDDISNSLKPGKWAIVSDISEELETPVDKRMVALGGTVFRTTRQNIIGNEQLAKEMAAIKANIAQLKAEQAIVDAEDKTTIQLKIDKLNKKLNLKLLQAKQRSKQQEEETKAKVEALKKKAEKAKGGLKAKIKSRIADIEKEFNESFEGYDWLHNE